MGAFLDKPKTEKTNHVGAGRDFKYAVASMQGWRVEMEDAHDVAIELQNSPPFDNWSFFAVFDGHAGNKVAQHSAENLLQTLLRTEEFKKLADELKANDCKMTDSAKALIREGMRTGFLELDEAMQAFRSDEKERSGTTAICALMTPDHVFVANLGDSRGVLSRVDDQTFSTEDHKPYLEKERERILKAGGSVMIQRVNGSLAVSRALGDYEYKSVPGLCPTEQLVSPEPDVYILDRNKDNDEFLVLACDGIYDVLSNEELCRLVRSRLQATDDLKRATNQVLDICLSLGSRDNMTMILVVLDAAPKTDPAKVESEREWLQRADHMLDEILKGVDVEHVDADLVMTLLKQEGCEELPIPGGIHLARSIIDNKLQKLLESHSPPAQEQNYGLGVGIGFVLASVVIFDFYPFEKRKSAFFVAAILFGGAGLYSNLIVGYMGGGYFATLFLVNLPSILAGLIYFLQREPFINRMCYSLEPLTANERSLISTGGNPLSPMAISYFLTALNASITVPIIMGFTSIIFESMGFSEFRSSQLSILYPLTQLSLLAGLRIPEEKKEIFSRKKLILGGYGLSLFLFFCFLLSIQGIEDDVSRIFHNRGIAGGLFFIFAVVVAVPSNTAVCFITERFPDRETQVVALSKSRMLLWIFSTIESATFLPILKSSNLFVTLLPYFVISVGIYAFLVMTLGSAEEEPPRKIHEYEDLGKEKNEENNNENEKDEEVDFHEGDCSL